MAAEPPGLSLEFIPRAEKNGWEHKEEFGKPDKAERDFLERHLSTPSYSRLAIFKNILGKKIPKQQTNP